MLSLSAPEVPFHKMMFLDMRCVGIAAGLECLCEALSFARLRWILCEEQSRETMVHRRLSRNVQSGEAIVPHPATARIWRDLAFLATLSALRA